MDTNIQIQSIKSQIENIKLQIDNIEMQSNNMLMMNNNSINEQILNLSIQMFNAGIQAFNTGKNMNMMMNLQNFYNQMKTISEQLNLILKENSMQPHPQQVIMQQQMQHPQILFQPNMISIEFKNTEGWKKFITIDFESTVEEALNRFIKKAYGSSINKKLVFFYNAQEIKRNEQRKIGDFFGVRTLAWVTVLED